MANIKGITIKIEGKTSGLTKALQAADRELKKTDAALKSVEKALELDPGNIELVAQKETLLAQKAELTTQRLETLKQVQSDALDKLDDGADISAAALAELSAEIVKTEKGLGSMDGSADAAAKDTDKVGDSAKKAGPAMEKLGSAAKKAGEVLAKAFTAAITAAGAATTATINFGKKVVGMANEVSEAGDAIDKNSQKVGLSAQTYQEYDYVMGLAGASMENMGTGLKTLTNQIGAAQSGNKDAIARFKELGLSVKDLGNMSREDVFKATISSLQNMADSTDRAALANKLFGKSGQELTPLFNMTNEELAQGIEEAHEYGKVMSDDLVGASAEYQDNLQKMQGALTGVKNEMLGDLLPGMTDFASGIADLVSGKDITGSGLLDSINTITDTITQNIVPKIQNFLTTILPVIAPALQQIFTSLSTIIGTLVETLGPPILGAISESLPGLIQSFGNFIIQNMSLFSSMLNSVLPPLVELLVAVVPPTLEALLNAIITNAGILLPAAMDLIITLVTGISDALPDLIPVAIEAVMLLVETLLDPGTLTHLLDAGLKILVSLMTGIADALPRLIPVIVQAVGVITETLIQHLPEIITAAIQIIMALISGLIQALPDIIAQGPKFLSAIVQMLADIPGKIVSMATSWGADLISNMISGFRQNMSKLKDAVGGIAKTIASFLHFSVPDVGPLSDFDESGGDMIDVFTQGMYGQMGRLKQALNTTAGVISQGMQPNYSGQLAGISGQLGRLNMSPEIVVPVSIGSDRLGVAMAKAQNTMNYRSGGH